jgi:hypothetical protein
VLIRAPVFAQYPFPGICAVVNVWFPHKPRHAVAPRVGLAYSYAYFSAKHLGEGQCYLMTIKDKDGNGLDGAKTYRLHRPRPEILEGRWKFPEAQPHVSVPEKETV